MKKSLLLSLLLAFCISVTAQNWVTIPDANFVIKLTQLFPQCMDGNLMNTECSEIVNATSLNVGNSNISNLNGIEYFVSLNSLVCTWNNLTSLPDLPQSLTYLDCFHSNLTSLPDLPQSLTYLDCFGNDLTALPELPISLTHLDCGYNNLTALPELPNSLNTLICFENNLINLPELPSSLTSLSCQNNQLNSLPNLPSSLLELFCHYNQLTYLPELPNGLTSLDCGDNQLICLPTLPISFTISSQFYIWDNNFTCMPNYVPAMSDANSIWLSYPLCDLTDLLDNPFGCSSLNGISGSIFHDENSNCQKDNVESGIVNSSLQLINEDEEVVAVTYAYGGVNQDVYNFVADPGNYVVQLVSDNMPFQASCVVPGSEQNVVLTVPSSSAPNVDFGVECVPGFDIGVQSVVTTGWVFPGQVHTLLIAAGDMSSWYGLQCAQGVGGTVTIFVDGPVSYVGPADNSLTPSVTGDWQFTYDIADFSLVNFQQDFGLLFETDTTAQAGELICVDIIVNPIDDDANPFNNTYNHCYEVVNSYDPNIKQVWPQNVNPGFDGYFNYTIYFQNTGTAPAFNIRLADTLDTNLDLNTFQVTNYSHPVLTYLHGNVLTFRFNNIMLPDSTTDLEGSIGFVQYRIKPIAGLPVGTVIENTAHIFFDFNDAIVTNTTINEYVIPTSVTNVTMPELLVFPNPGTGLFNVSVKNGSNSMHQSTLEIYTLRGQRILQQQMNENQTVLDLSTQPAGIYMLRLQNTFGTKTMKLVKQ